MDLGTILTVFAGGVLGVLLGKFLDEAPDWVFWALLVVLFALMLIISR